jgi:hypothetical protein
MSCKTQFELIIVDNNSTDQTKSVVNECNYPSIIYVFEEKQGLSIARNTGVRTANNEFLIFLDDDVKVSKRWLAAYADAIEHHGDQVFYGGPVVSEFEKQPRDLKLLDIAPASVRGLDYGTEVRLLDSQEHLLAANWACSKGALLAGGGFDIRLGLNPELDQPRVGEETALQANLRAQGLTCLYLPEASLRHFVPKEKINTRHIAARLEASAFQKSLQTNYCGPCVGKIPRWLLRKLATAWLDWIFSHITLTQTQRKYVKYRQVVGHVRGVRKANYQKHLATQVHETPVK